MSWSTRSSPSGKTLDEVSQEEFRGFLAVLAKLTNCEAQYEVTRIGTEINTVQKEIGLKKRAKEDATDLLKQKEELTQKKKLQEEVAAAKNQELKVKARLVGNYVHESVPISDNEDNNEIVKTWKPEGFDETKQQALSHHEVLWRLGGYDPVRGVKLVGHRGYCLTGYGMFL